MAETMWSLSRGAQRLIELRQRVARVISSVRPQAVDENFQAHAARFGFRKLPGDLDPGGERSRGVTSGFDMLGLSRGGEQKITPAGGGGVAWASAGSGVVGGGGGGVESVTLAVSAGDSFDGSFGEERSQHEGGEAKQGQQDRTDRERRPRWTLDRGDRRDGLTRLVADCGDGLGSG